MPADTVKKVANTCDMSISEVEDKWKKAKEKAESQGHAEDWGYVTSIFKNMLSKDCLEKLGWNNKKESTIMSTSNLINKIDGYLNESKLLKNLNELQGETVKNIDFNNKRGKIIISFESGKKIEFTYNDEFKFKNN